MLFLAIQYFWPFNVTDHITDVILYQALVIHKRNNDGETTRDISNVILCNIILPRWHLTLKLKPEDLNSWVYSHIKDRDPALNRGYINFSYE